MTPQGNYRNWFYSESCAPIGGAVAIVGLAGPVGVVDSLYGAGGYSVQLNLAAVDGTQLQPVLQAYPSASQNWAMWDAPQGKGIDKTASPLFSVAPSPSLPVLQAGGGLLVSLIADSPSTMLATLWPLWNGRFHGKPYYNVIGACHPIQSVALDICGIGGGSQAVFAPGTSFSLELTLQGIKDATYAGYGFGEGIPDAVA